MGWFKKLLRGLFGGGGGGGGGDGGVNVNALLQQQQAAFQTQQATAQAAHAEQMRALASASAADRAAVEKRFDEQQAALRSEFAQERAALEKKHDELTEAITASKQRLAEVKEELQRPIKDRQARVQFVNNLRLKLKQTKSLLLCGPKGTGKSTFAWLTGRGPKPSATTSDASTQLVYGDAFTDTIGMRGWTHDELCKLLVLLLYRGLPRDLILFSANDRVIQCITALALIGIVSPMIVILYSNFHKQVNKNKLRLQADESGILRIVPASDLDDVYDLDTYATISVLGIGKPVTHHEVFQAAQQRLDGGVRPFANVVDVVGSEFHVEMENTQGGNNMKEMLFRYVYVYEKKYRGRKNANGDEVGDLDFINNASMQEFSTL